jgi:hypothetical protein
MNEKKTWPDKFEDLMDKSSLIQIYLEWKTNKEFLNQLRFYEIN